MKTFLYLFLILILAFFNVNSFSQNETKNIVGKVIDGQNLFPLPFANVAYSDNKYGTSTDENGKFSLEVYKYSNNIIVSYVGYKTLVIDTEKIDQSKEQIFTLFPIDIFLQEVTVYSNQNRSTDFSETNSLSIQSERIKEISAAMPDILRSVQALPGIAVNNEFKADFNVRGGNQDENLVLVNGAQVYEPYHIKEAANASVGIFNVDLIKKVDLITGGFSARYGDKMSSVLNIEYREGNKKNYKGAASLSLAYADGFIEGPISKNSSFIFGIRKSYMEYVLEMIDYDDINTAQPSFYDIQGVINYDFSPTNKLVFEFIHAGDDFSYLPDNNNLRAPILGTFRGEPATYRTALTDEENNDASYFSNLFDIKSINVLSNKALLNLEVSYYGQKDSEFRTVDILETQEIATVGSNLIYFDNLHTNRFTYDSLTIATTEFKSNLLYQFTPKYEINTGISFQNISYEHDADDIWTYIRSDNFSDVNVTNSDTLTRNGVYGQEDPVDTESFKVAYYLENIFQVSDRFMVNVGGRLDYFDINKDMNISPRINFSYDLGSNTVLRGAWGHYYQSPDYRQLKSSIASDTNTTAQKSIHYIVGLEKTFFIDNKLNNFFKFKVEGYYKDYSNVISSFFGTFERLTYSRENDAIGNSKGIDVYALLNIPGFYTWISYGLLFANEDNLNDDIGEYPRYTDQRHTFSFVSNIELGSNWDITLKAFYGSGFPYTPKVAQTNSNNEWFWKSEGIHSAYLPDYKRVDFRISKSFIFSTSSLDMFIDISNIFNFKNIQQFEYETPGYSKPTVEEKELWPILPSFGIRWMF